MSPQRSEGGITDDSVSDLLVDAIEGRSERVGGPGERPYSTSPPAAARRARGTHRGRGGRPRLGLLLLMAALSLLLVMAISAWPTLSSAIAHSIQASRQPPNQSGLVPKPTSPPEGSAQAPPATPAVVAGPAIGSSAAAPGTSLLSTSASPTASPGRSPTPCPSVSPAATPGRTPTPYGSATPYRSPSPSPSVCPSPSSAGASSSKASASTSPQMVAFTSNCCLRLTGPWSELSKGGAPNFQGPTLWTTNPSSTATFNFGWGATGGGQGAGPARVRVYAWIPGWNAGAWVRYTVTTAAGGSGQSAAVDVPQQLNAGWVALPGTFALGSSAATGTVSVGMSYVGPYTGSGAGDCPHHSCADMGVGVVELGWAQ